MKRVEVDHIKLINKLTQRMQLSDILRKTGICHRTLKRLREDANANYNVSTINALIDLYNTEYLL